MDMIEVEIILEGLNEFIGQLSWYEDIAYERKEFKDRENMRALINEAFEISRNIKIKGADSIDNLKYKYSLIKEKFNLFYKKYSALMPEYVEQYAW